MFTSATWLSVANRRYRFLAAEPVPDLTQRFARRTALLRRPLELMALALAVRAGELGQCGIVVQRQRLARKGIRSIHGHPG